VRTVVDDCLPEYLCPYNFRVEKSEPRPTEPITRIIKYENHDLERVITGITLIRDAKENYWVEIEALGDMLTPGYSKAIDNEVIHQLLVEAGLEE
jgi:hypothetical protein